MDYDWHYFTKELEKDRQSLKRIIARDKIQALQTEINEKEYKEMCLCIKNYLHNYRNGNAKDRAFIERLVSVHRDMCNKEDDKEKNVHNAVVLRFMIKTPLSYRGVAKRLQVSRDTVINYIDECVGKMAILCYGFPAVRNTKQDRIKSILQSYPLIKASMEISERPFNDLVQQKRETYKNATIKAIKGLDVIFEYYENYVAFSEKHNKEHNRRALDIIKQLYIDEHKEIEQVATDFSVSVTTIYSEINKFITRVGRLFELI